MNRLHKVTYEIQTLRSHRDDKERYWIIFDLYRSNRPPARSLIYVYVAYVDKNLFDTRKQT